MSGRSNWKRPRESTSNMQRDSSFTQSTRPFPLAVPPATTSAPASVSFAENAHFTTLGPEGGGYHDPNKRLRMTGPQSYHTPLAQSPTVPPYGVGAITGYEGIGAPPLDDFRRPSADVTASDTQSERGSRSSAVSGLESIVPRVVRSIEALHRQLLALQKSNSTLTGAPPPEPDLRRPPNFEDLFESLDWGFKRLADSAAIVSQIEHVQPARRISESRTGSEGIASGHATSFGRLDEPFSTAGVQFPASNRAYSLPAASVPPPPLSYSAAVLPSSVATAAPPSLPSFNPSQSPTRTALQGVQHELSALKIRYDSLNTELNLVLGQLGRSQTRQATLERKANTAAEEVNFLSEDRQRLQTQLEQYEVQIEELQSGRDDAQRQSIASSEQWKSIVANSSMLERSSAEESRRWREERDVWQEEKAQLLSKIEELQIRSGGMTTGGHSAAEEGHGDESGSDEDGSEGQEESATISGKGKGPAGQRPRRREEESGDVLRSTSIPRLRNTITDLREENARIESECQRLRLVTANMKQVLAGLGEATAGASHLPPNNEPSEDDGEDEESGEEDSDDSDDE